MNKATMKTREYRILKSTWNCTEKNFKKNLLTSILRLHWLWLPHNSPFRAVTSVSTFRTFKYDGNLFSYIPFDAPQRALQNPVFSFCEWKISGIRRGAFSLHIRNIYISCSSVSRSLKEKTGTILTRPRCRASDSLQNSI